MKKIPKIFKDIPVKWNLDFSSPQKNPKFGKGTKLFKRETVDKFFGILERMDRHTPPEESKYTGHYKNNPHITPCEKEIFVNRTLKKLFQGKFVILYSEKEMWPSVKMLYKQFIYISGIKYTLGYGEELAVYYVDYSNQGTFSSKAFNYNKIVNLEGEWCEDNRQHKKVLEMFKINIPKKKYIFEAFDFSKYPKRQKKGVNPEDLMRTTVHFNAMTEGEAYTKLSEFVKKKRNKHLTVCQEIIEIQEIKPESSVEPRLFTEEELFDAARLSFEFHRTNDFDNDELEVEWKKWFDKYKKQITA